MPSDTEYTQRLTVAVPAGLLTASNVKSADANQLALCIGESASDHETFGHMNAQDKAAKLYSVISTVVKPIVSDMVAAPLDPPSHAPDVDIEAATRAQSLLKFGVPASTDVIAVIVSDRLETVADHMSLLGLSLSVDEEYSL